MINKTLVKERFKKNLKTYKDNSVIQDKMAEKLISLIDCKTDSILELGAGCGVLTEKICNNFNYNTYNTVDIVRECEEYIKNISTDIKFIESDIEHYEFKEKYDLIISNATFQWLNNLSEFISRLKNNLNEDGMIIFSTFGAENFKEIKELTGIGLKYYTKGELTDILNPQYIEEDILTMKFNTPIEVLKHLKLTGVNSIESRHWTKTDLIKFESQYKIVSPNIKLTYNPIYVCI